MLKVTGRAGAPTLGSLLLWCSPHRQCTASVMLSNHRAKLTEDSGTCFQFLKMRYTVATSPVTDKFVSLLSLWSQPHYFWVKHPTRWRIQLTRASPPPPTFSHSLAPSAGRQLQASCGAWKLRTPPSSQALSAPPAPGRHLHAPHRHVLNTSHICKGVGHMGDELTREGSSTRAHFPQPLEQKYERTLLGKFFQSAPLPSSESSLYPYYYSSRSQALRSY